MRSLYLTDQMYLTARGRGAPQPITAIIAPALGPLVGGDAIEDALSADIGEVTNYRFEGGDPGVGIDSVTITATVNGDPADLTDTVSFEDAVVVTVTVTPDVGDARVFSLARTVGASAPNAFGPGDWEILVEVS